MKTVDRVYQALATGDEGRLCKDIPESACNEQPLHFFTHISSLTLSKLADSFVDPKLILSWLLSNLGISSAVIGVLVPIREAGALLPQLFFSEWIRTRKQRKWVWATGAIIQGLAALAMVLCVLTLANEFAGVAVLFCLLVLAIARSFCSVSYKDVLGKTVSKSTRGTTTGTANSLAAAGTITFALLLGLNIFKLNTDTILVLLSLAGILWIISAFNFVRLREEKGSTEGGKNGANNLIGQLKSSFANKQFRLFVATRGLLTATALAPPFMILMVTQISNQNSNSNVISLEGSSNAGQLGLLLLASALASLTSSFVWGRLSDHSSKKVLVLASFLAAVTMFVTFVLAVINPGILPRWFGLPVLLFCLMVAYQGIRLGRSTHLVDMATEETRASFTAVSNSSIGILLMLGSSFGWLAKLIGTNWLIFIFACMCLLASFLALRLKNAQKK